MEIDKIRAEIRCLMLDAEEFKNTGEISPWTFIEAAEAIANENWQAILDASSDPAALALLWSGGDIPSALHLIAAESKSSQDNNSPSDWLTVAEIADELRCSTQSVRDMIKAGKLKATEVGTGEQRKTYTIKRSDLEALAKVHDEQPAKLSHRNKSGQDDNRWGLR